MTVQQNSYDPLMIKAQDDLRTALAGEERLLRLLEEAVVLMEQAKRAVDQAGERVADSHAEIAELHAVIDGKLASRNPARAAA